ncbi:MAG: thioredoxin family protein [Gammaproteobacteria bacterium]|nr:thioredoxin family protein [Gammaproteobacteria bacterium]
MQTPRNNFTRDTDITWHNDGLDRAFANARIENRPVFLFWSAKWCPDSAQVQVAIFDQPEFISRIQRFIAVHIDGDDEQAQWLGEPLGISNYPSMTIFAPDGRQITRLPSEIGIQHYAHALDSALAVMTPVSTLLREFASDSNHQLGEDEWRMLAYYNWEQDGQRAWSGLDPVPVLTTLAEACPDNMPIERSRLFVAGVRAMLGSGSLSETDRRSTAEQLIKLLAQPDLCLANLDMIINHPAPTTAGLTRAGSPLRRSLASAWLKSLDALEGTGKLSATQRVYITRARIRLLRIDNTLATLPSALLEQALAKADCVDANTSGRERVPAVNAVANTLTEAGLFAEATSLLLRELTTATSPFYFMNKLSIAARKAGQTRQALAWLERAHAEAMGPATRFQWGVNLVIGLVDMAPGEADTIEQTAASLISELGNSVNPLHNRNVTRLQQLDSKLRQWNESNLHAESLQHIRAALAGVCASLRENQAVPLICQEFLAA